MNRRFLTRIFLLALAVFLIVILINITGIFLGSSDTYPAQLGTIEVAFDTEGILIRREIVYSSSVGGSVEFLVDDNTRVAKGAPILRINPGVTPEDKPVSKYVDRLDSLMIDLDALQARIRALEDELSYLVRENKFDEIDGVKKNLDHLYVIQNSYDTPELTLEPVTATGETVGGRHVIRAPMAGIVGLRMSPSDPLFAFNNRMIINYKALGTPEEGDIPTDIAPSEGLFRIIDNRASFVVLVLDQKEFEMFRGLEGERINAVINEIPLRPVVEEIFETNEQNGVVLRFLETFEGDQDMRTVRIRVIPKRFSGLVIKTSSIVEEGNTQGVFVMHGENDFSFVPIRLKGVSGDEAVIYSDYFYVGDDAEPTETVSLYDEIKEVGR